MQSAFDDFIDELAMHGRFPAPSSLEAVGDPSALSDDSSLVITAARSLNMASEPTLQAANGNAKVPSSAGCADQLALESASILLSSMEAGSDDAEEMNDHGSDADDAADLADENTKLASDRTGARSVTARILRGQRLPMRPESRLYSLHKNDPRMPTPTTESKACLRALMSSEEDLVHWYMNRYSAFVSEVRQWLSLTSHRGIGRRCALFAMFMTVAHIRLPLPLNVQVQNEEKAYNMAVFMSHAYKEWSMPLSTIRFDIVCRIVSALLAHDIPEGLRQQRETPVPRGGVSHVDRVAAQLLSLITETWTQSRRCKKHVHHELRSHVLWHNLSFWSSTFVHMVQDKLRSLFAPLFQCEPHEVIECL